MKRRDIADRGQVLIIFVFAIVGLIGMTGIAIDGGNVYSDRRHAQNAADTAALAGALTKIKEEKNNQVGCWDVDTPTTCGAKVKNAARDMAAENGYDGLPHDGRVTNEVEVHIPPSSGFYSSLAACNYSCNPYDYIEVIISSNVDTWFAKVLGIQQLHNQVQAVARATFSPESKLYGGNSLVELRPHSGPGCGADVGNGGADVYLGGASGLILQGGGIFVNSDNQDCALKITNTCPLIDLQDGATVTGLGGQFDGCEPPILEPATEGYPYPPEDSPVHPIPPAECFQPIYTGTGTPNTDGTFHYSAGHYSKLPPEKNTTLEPGVYCVEDLIKTTNSYAFYGDGVFMYVRAGGDFSFNGGTIQLVAPGFVFPGKTDPAPVSAATKPYEGYLIYVDENDWESSPSDCTINGASDTVLRGVIYAPHCNVKIDGGSGTFGITAQVIAYTLNLQGRAVLNFIYNDEEMPGIPEMNLTGLFH